MVGTETIHKHLWNAYLKLFVSYPHETDNETEFMDPLY